MAGAIPPVAPEPPAGCQGLSYAVDPVGLTQPVLKAVLDYWEKKRAGRRLPSRADIDPQDLKPYLRHLFLIEVLGGAEFRDRLVGSEITERYGRNSTGKTVTQIYSGMPALRDWLTGMLLEVTRTARPVLACGPLAAINKNHILSDSLHLPLADDGETATMIFGATCYSPRGR